MVFAFLNITPLARCGQVFLSSVLKKNQLQQQCQVYVNKEFWTGVMVIIMSNFYRFLLCQIIHFIFYAHLPIQTEAE